jgi:hypothetical protein
MQHDSESSLGDEKGNLRTYFATPCPDAGQPTSREGHILLVLKWHYYVGSQHETCGYRKSEG